MLIAKCDGELDGILVTDYECDMVEILNDNIVVLIHSQPVMGGIIVRRMVMKNPKNAIMLKTCLEEKINDVDTLYFLEDTVYFPEFNDNYQSEEASNETQ
jgi:hypothetical protein